MEPFKYNVLPGRYRHFKGNEYEVLGMARHSETEEEMVVYRALYGERGLWVRPAAMWCETAGCSRALCALKRLSNFPDRSAGAMPSGPSGRAFVFPCGRLRLCRAGFLWYTDSRAAGCPADAF